MKYYSSQISLGCVFYYDYYSEVVHSLSYIPDIPIINGHIWAHFLISTNHKPHYTPQVPAITMHHNETFTTFTGAVSRSLSINQITSKSYLACNWLLTLCQSVPADKLIPALCWDQDVVKLIDEMLLDGQHIPIWR